MSSAKPLVKRTYGTQTIGGNSFSSSLQVSVNKRKLNILHGPSTNPQPPKKRARTTNNKPVLTQLHLNLDGLSSTLRACKICGITYTKGATDDERLHKLHCARVQKGVIWGREEERERLKGSATVAASDMQLPGGGRGRILYMNADATGKLGQMIAQLLETVNTALSSPALSRASLRASKIYVFLMQAGTASQEKVVGCVVAQRISSAMRIVQGSSSDDDINSLILVDGGIDGNIYCDPVPLPTHMGVSRLWVTSTCRRKGIAFHLLKAAADTFIHGLVLNPEDGDIAFSQPTSLGQLVMKKWGKGNIRIYEERK